MNLKREYKLALNFLRESKLYFIFATFIFLLSILIGLAYPFIFAEEIKSLLNTITKMIEGLSTFQLIIFIIENNLMTSFIGMIFGVILSIPSLSLLIINGYILGFVMRYVIEEEGIPILWKLLPHGIFELPALIVSLGMGLKIGGGILSKNRRDLKYIFFNSIRTFALIVIPLLIIAGIIEGLLITFVK